MNWDLRAVEEVQLFRDCPDCQGYSVRNMSSDQKLRRQNGIVAGVCGGLAAFTGINVFWFRLLFAILMLPGGLPGFVPYVLLWIIIPGKR